MDINAICVAVGGKYIKNDITQQSVPGAFLSNHICCNLGGEMHAAICQCCGGWCVEQSIKNRQILTQLSQILKIPPSEVIRRVIELATQLETLKQEIYGQL